MIFPKKKYIRKLPLTYDVAYTYFHPIIDFMFSFLVVITHFGTFGKNSIIDTTHITKLFIKIGLFGKYFENTILLTHQHIFPNS